MGKNCEFYLENNNFEEYISFLCDKYKIRNWSINNGLVDVNGYVILSDIGLDKLPINFGKVNGGFYCQNNNLTTLKGSPRYVGGHFWCQDNELTTLEEGPIEVGEDFKCDHNQLTTLKGSPMSMNGSFICNNNNLKTLEYSPRIIGRDFMCNNNHLVSLSGCPDEIKGDFSFSKNNVENLDHFPKFWSGKVNFQQNPRIKHLYKHRNNLKALFRDKKINYVLDC